MQSVRSGKQFLFGTLILSAAVSFLSAAARVPTSAAPIVRDTLILHRNGQSNRIALIRIGRDEYLGVDQLAGLAQAQLRWQAVSQQACLSSIRGLVCFNWSDSIIYKDGQAARKSYHLRFENNQLYVPMHYVLSKDFQEFSQTELEWDSKSKELTQTIPINLEIPKVERLSDRYQLRLETPGDVPHYLIEDNDNRIWVRFVKAHSYGSQILEGDGVIRQVRIIQRRHSADLVIKLGDDALSHEIYFDEGRKNLVLDVFTTPQLAKSRTPSALEKPTRQASNRRKNNREISLTRENRAIQNFSYDSKSIVTVVIDPGHGGMDAGAIGSRGTLEKDINLEVARALAKQFEKEKNVKVILTRKTDKFIPLNERTNIANAAGADLFVSIHCNSSLSLKGQGFETYFLSPSATDKAAEAVARLENSVVALEVKKGESSSRLEELLASMAVHNQINESSRFAAILCRSVKDKTPLDKAVVKEADFYVLRGAQMPAVLIELEYLSNPLSEIKLRSTRFRSQVVKGLMDGILTFDRQLRQEKEAIAAQVETTASQAQR